MTILQEFARSPFTENRGARRGGRNWAAAGLKLQAASAAKAAKPSARTVKAKVGRS